MSLPNLEPLILTDAQLQLVREALRQRIREGLQEDGQELKCLPAHLPPPAEGLRGRAIVVDTGGTNMRAAVVEISAEPRIEKGPITRPLPARSEDHRLDADGFFDVQAALVEELAPDRSLPVGYCFSYPSHVEPSRDARLISWTKNIDIPGVEGALVGTWLRRALERRGFTPPRLPVLNDTVASMLGGATTRTGTGRTQIIGLIAGTGSNMAAFFSPERAPKLESGPMAINLESGNFDPPLLTAWDRAVDDASDNPGAQRFEKAVAGYYLPFLFAEILTLEGFDPAAGSRQLVELRDSGDGDGARLAEVILARAADLVAAGLAAVADFYDGDVEVVAEGSLFWRDPLFAPRVRNTLDRLIVHEPTVFRLEDANLIGSAVAALTE